jgi:ech hydrogenase subunit C
VKQFIKKAPWISFYDSGDCNGCVLEVLALLTPKYDIERLGCLKRASAKHADIMMVSGTVNQQTKKRMLKVHQQLPDPKVVIAVGSCPISNGVFKPCYNSTIPFDTDIPVTVYAPGCPPRPETLIDAVVKALATLDKKEKK